MYNVGYYSFSFEIKVYTIDNAKNDVQELWFVCL